MRRGWPTFEARCTWSPNKRSRTSGSDAIANPPVEGETRNNIYIHVPFCKSICSFCNYERLRPSNPDLEGVA